MKLEVFHLAIGDRFTFNLNDKNIMVVTEFGIHHLMIMTEKEFLNPEKIKIGGGAYAIPRISEKIVYKIGRCEFNL